MLCRKEGWTLVCYAGPASKASIGSKPIGSELVCDLGIYPQHVNKELTRLIEWEAGDSPTTRGKSRYLNRFTVVAE